MKASNLERTLVLTLLMPTFTPTPTNTGPEKEKRGPGVEEVPVVAQAP